MARLRKKKRKQRKVTKKKCPQWFGPQWFEDLADGFADEVEEGVIQHKVDSPDCWNSGIVEDESELRCSRCGWIYAMWFSGEGVV